MDGKLDPNDPWILDAILMVVATLAMLAVAWFEAWNGVP